MALTKQGLYTLDPKDYEMTLVPYTEFYNAQIRISKTNVSSKEFIINKPINVLH